MRAFKVELENHLKGKVYMAMGKGLWAGIVCDSPY